MKRKFWIGIGVALPLALFGATLAAREAASWRPRLVATDPDGSCEVTWSGDGRWVRLDPVDLRQNLQWGSAYFEARWQKRDANGQKRFVASGFEIRANYPDFNATDDQNARRDALSVCQNPGGACRPLRGTTWKLHGVEQFDASTSGWNFQALQFSLDERELSILSAGEVRVWSTQSGELLRKIKLTAPPNSVQSAVFSSDRKLIAARIMTSSSEDEAKLVVFDGARGTKRFAMASEQNRGFGFSASNAMFWAADLSPRFSDDEGDQLSFYYAHTGHFLWKCLRYGDAKPLFAPGTDVVLIPGLRGLQVRRTRNGHLERTFNGPARTIYRAAFSPDGSRVWSSHHDGQIWSWRVH